MNEQLPIVIHRRYVQRRMMEQIEKRFGPRPKPKTSESEGSTAGGAKLPQTPPGNAGDSTPPAAKQPDVRPKVETSKPEASAPEAPVAPTDEKQPSAPGENSTQVQNLYDKLLAETGEQLSAIGEKAGPDMMSTGTKKGEDTMALHGIWSKGKFIGWTPERLAWQNQTLTDMEMEQGEKSGRVSPTGKKAIIMAGLPGAGKTHILDSVLSEHVDTRDYTIVDADDIKQKIVEGGDIPAAEGLEGMQLSPLAHEEASSMAKRWIVSLMGRGSNMAIDILASNPEKTQRLIDSLKQAGYEVSMVYVEVSPQEAAVSVLQRFKSDGRPIPPSYIRSMARGSEGSAVASAIPKYLEAINGNFWHYRGYPVSKQPPILVDSKTGGGGKTPEAKPQEPAPEPNLPKKVEANV